MACDASFLIHYHTTVIHFGTLDFRNEETLYYSAGLISRYRLFSQSILRFFLFSLMTKPLNTQNEWMISTLIRAVAGFCLVSLDVKQNYINQSHESIKCAKKSILLLLALS